MGRPEQTLTAVNPSRSASLQMHRGEVRRGHVVHVHEVPHLAAVFENLWWLAFFNRRAEDRGHPE